MATGPEGRAGDLTACAARPGARASGPLATALMRVLVSPSVWRGFVGAGNKTHRLTNINAEGRVRRTDVGRETRMDEGKIWARIMAPLSGGEGDRLVVAAATALAEPFGAEMACVHAPPDVADLIPWMGDGFMGGTG